MLGALVFPVPAVRNGNGDHMSDGYGLRSRCDGLDGGTFALPYCDYCTRHAGDRSC
jgi:hypothetical protein